MIDNRCGTVEVSLRFMMELSKGIQYYFLHKPLPFFLQGYVWLPVLYCVFLSAVWTWVNVSGLIILGGLNIVIYWFGMRSVLVRCALTYRKASSIQDASMVKVVPTPENGSPELVELVKKKDKPTGEQLIWFRFRGIKYVYKNGEFRALKHPISQCFSFEDYNQNKKKRKKKSQGQRLVIQNRYKWPKHDSEFLILKVYFMEPPQSGCTEDKILNCMRGWSKHCGVKFERTLYIEHSDIRITFRTDHGNITSIGTAAKDTIRDTTMNLEDIDETTILHETGHALGFVHEFQHPNVNIQWKMEKLKEHFSREPHFWTDDEIEKNITNRFDNEVSAIKPVDPKSIMMYKLERCWMSNPESLPNGFFERNTKLSKGDKQMAAELYPKPPGLFQYLQDKLSTLAASTMTLANFRCTCARTMPIGRFFGILCIVNVIFVGGAIYSSRSLYMYTSEHTIGAVLSHSRPVEIDGADRIRNFSELLNAVQDIGDWQALCINLKVSIANMEMLLHSPMSSSEKKRECLTEYYDHGGARWSDVIEAVSSYPVSNKRLAAQISRKYFPYY